MRETLKLILKHSQFWIVFSSPVLGFSKFKQEEESIHTHHSYELTIAMLLMSFWVRLIKGTRVRLAVKKLKVVSI